MVPRIRQIQIQNYKSIGQAVVDLEPFTVVVGANGTGKSNFVDVLAFVQECLSYSIGRALEARGGPRVLSRWQARASELPRLGFRFIIDLQEDTRADYAFELAWSLGEQPQVARERCTIHIDNREAIAFEVAEGRFIQEIPGIRSRVSPDRLALFAASATNEFRPLYDFLTAMRSYNIDPRSLGLPQSLDSGDNLKVEGSNAASVLRRIRENQGEEQFERISRLLSLAVRGIEGVGYVVEEDTARVRLSFRQDIGLQEPGIFQGWEMSAGTLRLLGLLLASYQPGYTAVLAIEEPEATIHPAAADLMIQVLMDASHDRQVLITTHSPDLLDYKELKDQQIRVVSLERGHTSIAPLSRASRQAIQERLYTAGELLRLNELDDDIDGAKQAARGLDLLTLPTSSSPAS